MSTSIKRFLITLSLIFVASAVAASFEYFTGKASIQRFFAEQDMCSDINEVGFFGALMAERMSDAVFNKVKSDGGSYFRAVGAVHGYGRSISACLHKK